jgi:hypothetical protein
MIFCILMCSTIVAKETKTLTQEESEKKGVTVSGGTVQEIDGKLTVMSGDISRLEKPANIPTTTAVKVNGIPVSSINGLVLNPDKSLTGTADANCEIGRYKLSAGTKFIYANGKLTCPNGGVIDDGSRKITCNGCSNFVYNGPAGTMDKFPGVVLSDNAKIDVSLNPPGFKLTGGTFTTSSGQTISSSSSNLFIQTDTTGDVKPLSGKTNLVIDTSTSSPIFKGSCESGQEIKISNLGQYETKFSGENGQTFIKTSRYGGEDPSNSQYWTEDEKTKCTVNTCQDSGNSWGAFKKAGIYLRSVWPWHSFDDNEEAYMSTTIMDKKLSEPN